MSRLDQVHCVMRVKMKDEDEDDEEIGDDDDDYLVVRVMTIGGSYPVEKVI